jgi:hypothetical protein
MIGINDAQLLGYDPSETVQTIRLIISKILRASPDAVYLCSDSTPVAGSEV